MSVAARVNGSRPAAAVWLTTPSPAQQFSHAPEAHQAALLVPFHRRSARTHRAMSPSFGRCPVRQPARTSHTRHSSTSIMITIRRATRSARNLPPSPIACVGLATGKVLTLLRRRQDVLTQRSGPPFVDGLPAKEGEDAKTQGQGCSKGDTAA